MPPRTLDAVTLLGWMEQEEAITYLLEECWFDPSLDREQAMELWTKYHDRVQALARVIPQPLQRFPIPAGCGGHVTNFLRRRRHQDVQDVINIDPMNLIIYQFYMTTDRVDHHQNHPDSWARKTLVIDRPTMQLPHRVEGDTIKFILPHAEHLYGFKNCSSCGGGFQIQQFAGFVSVVDIGGGRLLLKAGYHRSYAFARTVTKAPEAKDRCELVALTTSLPPQLTPASPQHGLKTIVFGARPPLFADFFDSDLAMIVKLRKKRWEAHLRIARVDDP